MIFSNHLEPSIALAQSPQQLSTLAALLKALCHQGQVTPPYQPFPPAAARPLDSFKDCLSAPKAQCRMRARL